MQDEEDGNQRRFPRISARLPLLVREGTGSDSSPLIPAEVRTIAAEGCMFLHEKEFSPNSRLQLTISLHGWVIETAARVVWQRPALTERGVEVGVEFIHISPADRALIEAVLQRIPMA